MRMISVNIDDTRITFDNCMWTGYEYIRVNGQVISKGFSWFGMDHIFEVEENGEWVEYVVTTGRGFFCLGTLVTRNGIVIADTSTSGEVIIVSINNRRVYRKPTRRRVYRESEFV